MLLLTGATGHVGGELLPRLLREPGVCVLALIRAPDADALEARRARLVSRWGLDEARLLAVRGDVSAPGLGLSGADREMVLSECTSILHSAASVRFDLPPEEAAAQNVAGAEAVLALADALGSRLQRLDHVSTAYVAGDRRDLALEAECEVGQGFRNSYEWSKCQAELRVRAAIAGGMPASIHRPSIVVGASDTGRTDSFNVLYWPLKLYARGWWRTVPGDPSAPIDVVPVDFVAEAIVRLRQEPSTRGACFHLCAGPEAPTLGELAERVGAMLPGPGLRFVAQGPYRRWIRPLLWPFWLTPRGRAIRRGGDVFLPYLAGNPRFDVRNARAALGPLRPPPVAEYLERVVRYAVDRDFGHT